MKTKSVERGAAMLGCARALVTIMLVVSCGKEAPLERVDASTGDASAGDASTGDANLNDFAVHGTATGVLGPVVLELRVGDEIETLSVTQEGAFTFETRLRNGASYSVAFLVPDAPCTLRNQNGVIAGADTAIELTCTGPSLANVAVSAVDPPLIMLVPDATDYAVDLSLLQQFATVTATVATPSDTLTIAGVTVASGAPSEPIGLSLGDNLVDIVVENSLGWQRTYRLVLRRGAELAQYAYGKASNTGIGDQFGYSVALSGDTLAVGAYLEASSSTGPGANQGDDSAPGSGAVYVFRRTGSNWQQEAYLKASNTDADDYFGCSVALSDDTLVVGAYREASAATGINGDQADNNAGVSGAVYVFRRTGTSWHQEAYVKPSNTGAFDSFGISVALSGDTLAVGAPQEDSAAVGPHGNQSDNSASDSGAVYVFRRTGTNWQQEVYLKASNTGVLDGFGTSVSISGDMLAVGAPQEDSAAVGSGGNQGDNSAGNSGAVYVFRRSGTNWLQEDYLKASNTGASDGFGTSVSISGDMLAVGAPQEDSAAVGPGGNQSDNSAGNSGAVYVFRRTGSNWQQEAYLKASNTGASDFFGGSLALSGDTLAVGAFGEDSAATGIDGNQADNSASLSGAVYLLRVTGTTWQQEAYLKASNTSTGDSFGTNVALAADTLAVGAFSEDSAARGTNGDQADNAASDSGAIYVYH